MLRYALVLVAFFAFKSMALAVPEDDISNALEHAEALYYDARFKEAIEVLLRVDDVLRPKADQVKEKVNVKLQLALAYTGLNDSVNAKKSFRELFALDADYRLNPQDFSPKIISVSEEAREQQNEIRCQEAGNNAQRLLEAQNTAGLLSLLGSMKSNCAVLESMQPKAAELLYKRGLDSYKRSDFSGALQDFREAVRLSPTHELAAQYVELTQGKLQVNAQYSELTQSKLQLDTDRLLLDWRQKFDAHEFAPASDAYRKLAALRGSDQMLNQMRQEYRKVLSGYVEPWRTACARGDTAAMDTILHKISELLPEASIGEDIQRQMPPCANLSCLKMNAPLALARLKTRVNPDFPASIQAAMGRTPITVRVKAKIDEKGDVTAGDSQGSNMTINESVRAAVAKWKFSPIVDENGPRCVDTEFPIVIKTQ